MPVAARLITHEAQGEEAGYGDAEEMRLILFCYYVFQCYVRRTADWRRGKKPISHRNKNTKGDPGGGRARGRQR